MKSLKIKNQNGNVKSKILSFSSVIFHFDISILHLKGLSFFILIFAFYILALPKQASAAVSNLGLVGYWSFNEGTGSYAGDSSGNRNQGTLTNGPTWVDGKRGKAINFDGSNDYVVSGAAFSDLGTTNKPYTLSAWIKANTGETTGNIINSYIAGLGGWRLGMVTLSTSKIVVNSWVGSRSTATSTTSITPGQWYHVVNTWD